MQQGAADHCDIVTGFVSGVGLLMGQRIRHHVRNVLDEAAAQCHVQQLLAAANSEDRDVAFKRAAGDRYLEAGPLGLQDDALVVGFFAE